MVRGKWGGRSGEGEVVRGEVVREKWWEVAPSSEESFSCPLASPWF